jgi:Tfp pilus assembly protein PilO
MARIIGFWKNLSARERTMISLAIGIAVVFITFNYVLDPVLQSYDDKKDRLDSLEQLLTRYEHILATADRTRENLERIAAIESSINQGLLKGSSPDLANAELQGIAREIADQADISFTRITPSRIVEEDGFMLISLRLPFTGNIKQLVTFLHEVEKSPYLLTVPSLTIRTQRRGLDILRIEVELTGYIRSPKENDIDSDTIDLARF